MDSLTHIVLGACIGEAALPKRLGKKALIIGAIAQSLPDIDIVGALWNSTAEDLWFHRGITHSFIFGLIAAVFLGLLSQRVFRRYHLYLPRLIIFFCLQIWLHDVLDTCNSYGTGLLEPFSHERFSFNLLFVLDPFFSLPMVLVFFFLLFFKTGYPHRKKWIFLGLLIPCCYILYAVSNKISVEKQVSRHLPAKTRTSGAFISTPTAFNSWLWYIMIPADSGFYIGYRSVYDSKEHVTSFEYFPRRAYLLKGAKNAKQLSTLKKFADQYYTVENRHDTLVFNVLRFGRIAGWDGSTGNFTFQFYLNEGFDNNLVVQRGRAEEVNLATFKRMYYRIKGLKE